MYAAVKLAVQPGKLDCYLMTIPAAASALHSLLGHDPRSSKWKTNDADIRDLYEKNQRKTSTPRIEGLRAYLNDTIMATDNKFGALPPISIVQFAPFAPDEVVPIEGVPGAVRIDLSRNISSRMLIDGLARVTAILDLAATYRMEAPAAAGKLAEMNLGVAFYVPSAASIDKTVAGQLFHDFNSYAWAVSSAKALSSDSQNPYKQIAVDIGDHYPIMEFGGLKDGSSTLSVRDKQFTTTLTMSRFVKIVVEGARAYGKFSKPIVDASILKVSKTVLTNMLVMFFDGLCAGMGDERFGDRREMIRSAHALEAIAVLLHEILIARDGSLIETAPVAKVARDLSEIDWTWDNTELQTLIGRETKPGSGEWRMETGQQTKVKLVAYCRAHSQTLSGAVRKRKVA